MDENRNEMNWKGVLGYEEYLWSEIYISILCTTDTVPPALWTAVMEAQALK